MQAADLFKQAEADAAELGITVREALALHFAAQAALAHMARNAKAEAVFHCAGRHAAGNMDGAMMRQCFAAIDAVGTDR